MSGFKPIPMPDDFSNDELLPIMAELRQYYRDNKARIDAEWDAIVLPPRTAEAHLATLSPERRAELNKDWTA